MLMNKMKEMSWANKRNVTIYPVPIDRSQGVYRPMCNIIVNVNGRIYRSKEQYKQNAKMYDEIIKLYERYYEKNRPN
jgi:predicted NAD-dependent protein-ADP-ribosyltransferase YbiA (DUF1768 family)